DHLRSVPLTSEPMTVLCHPEHGLARSGAPVTPHDLAGQVFVGFHPDWGPRRATDAAFASAGGLRPVAREVLAVPCLLDLVDQDLGAAVVPRHFLHKGESLAPLPLKGTGEAVNETVGLVRSPRATSPAARALMALLGDGSGGD